MIRRILAVRLPSAICAGARPARAGGGFAIAAMNDESGPHADLAGPEMARMAIEDFGGEAFGRLGAGGRQLTGP